MSWSGRHRIQAGNPLAVAAVDFLLTHIQSLRDSEGCKFTLNAPDRKPQYDCCLHRSAEAREA